MAWRIYKEGQGKWFRGIMAAIIFVVAVFAVMNLHNLLDRLIGGKEIIIPFIDWPLDWRYPVDAVVLIAILAWAVSLYNKPRVVDFLVETENEMKNRVTWPTRKEGINASIVVVITVTIMMLYIFGIDAIFSEIKEWVFHPPKVTKDG